MRPLDLVALLDPQGAAGGGGADDEEDGEDGDGDGRVGGSRNEGSLESGSTAAGNVPTVAQCTTPAARASEEGQSLLQQYGRLPITQAADVINQINGKGEDALKVQKIVEKQQGFFDHGVLHLKPLILQDIAREIDMHESTVSRVTNGKYVQTPRGVFELKFFFSSGLHASDGEDISSKAAKEKIHRLIESEDKHKPLSDQKIADMLKGQGVDIARRTVAKYREQMGTPSARMRKRH